MYYVIGDIHGCYKEFQSMLKLIEFNQDNDTMFFVGDYIDRGADSYSMFRWLEKNCSNEHFKFIKGNHEQEFCACVELLDSIQPANGLLDMCNKLHEKASYFDTYGTIRKLIQNNNINIVTLCRWAKMFKEMPYYQSIDYCNNHYVIVHAGFQLSYSEDSSRDFFIYAREEAFIQGGQKDSIIISGHTPTFIEGEFVFNNGNVFKYFRPEINCTYYDIDCGCCFRRKYSNAKLACIRLDDMEVFYI